MLRSGFEAIKIVECFTENVGNYRLSDCRVCSQTHLNHNLIPLTQDFFKVTFEMISHDDNGFLHLVRIKTSLTTTNGNEYRTRGQGIRTTVWTQKSPSSFVRTIKSAI
jgi:hypothetical protein